jgi:uncharacterized coiled-coil DUF342 family protein
MTELEAYKKTLEEVIKERDEARDDIRKLVAEREKEQNEARAEVERLNAQILEYQCRCNPYVSLVTQKDLDEARSEVEKLKDSVRAQTENANYWRDMYSKQGIGSRIVEKQSTPTCPEPSRLEIAADILCVWESRAEITNVDRACKDALSIADTLIAAAKEEVVK